MHARCAAGRPHPAPAVSASAEPTQTACYAEHTQGAAATPGLLLSQLLSPRCKRWQELWQELWNRSPNKVLGQGSLRQGAVAERVYGTAATITAVPQLSRSSASLGAHLVSREDRPGQGGSGVGGLHSRHHMGACCCSARARDAVYRAHQCPAPHEKHALHGIALWMRWFIGAPNPDLQEGSVSNAVQARRASARSLPAMQT